MTEMYKGQRISELLEMINRLQHALDENRDGAVGEDVFRIVESESTLAIMKAKLTALQGEK
jgi:NifU-like protein involved in Fe-S cluster formation